MTLDTRMASAKVSAELVDGLKSVPLMAILSHEGDVATTSVGAEGNVGFPRTEAARTHFRKMLETTSRRLSAVEIDTLLGAIDEQN